MKKICFIIPYFSDVFPAYFSYFLKSASWNESIDFLIFSNAQLPVEVKNVKTILFSLQDFNKLASEKLQLNIALTKPYKLCDFKPTYGLVFEDYIKKTYKKELKDVFHPDLICDE